MTKREGLATACVAALVLVVYVVHEGDKRALDRTLGSQLQTFMHHVADSYVGVRTERGESPSRIPHLDPIEFRDWRGTANIDGLMREARLEMPEIFETFSEDLREALRDHLQAFVDKARHRWHADGYAYGDRRVPMTLNRYLAQFGDRAQLWPDGVWSLAEDTAKNILRSYRRSPNR